MAEIRIATRASALAQAQARRVAALVERATGAATALVPVTTSGDRDRTSPVAALTEVGAFVRAVQQAVLDGDADLAVHSCKDLPVAGPAALVRAYPERESPFDALCGSNLADLPPGAVVGTGSPRRAAQLRVLRPDLNTAEVRGNVDTRLGRVAAGDFAAIVLAEAGLRRLGRADAVAAVLTLDEMVPAPGQGALAVEALTGSTAADVLAAIDDAGIRRCVETERTLLALTGAGCRSALGALATGDADRIRLTAFADDERGPRRATVVTDDPLVAAEGMRRELSL